MIQYAFLDGSTGYYIVEACVFSATMILLYLTSALYHALPKGNAKRIFRSIEHSAIFLLITGTYTPYTLGVLSDACGWSIFGGVWGAVLGVTLKNYLSGFSPYTFYQSIFVNGIDYRDCD